jgi:hypothetical protein
LFGIADHCDASNISDRTTVMKGAEFEFRDFSEQYDSLASDGAAIIFGKVNTFLPLQITL